MQLLNIDHSHSSQKLTCQACQALDFSTCFFLFRALISLEVIAIFCELSKTKTTRVKVVGMDYYVGVTVNIRRKTETIKV